MPPRPSQSVLASDRHRSGGAFGRDMDTNIETASVGGSLHLTDVVSALSTCNVPPASRNTVFAELRSVAHMRAFYESYAFLKEPVSGSTDHDFWRAFEASYCGRFRRHYVRAVLLRLPGVGTIHLDRRYLSEPQFSYFLE